MTDFGYGGFQYGFSPYGASPSPYIYIINLTGYTIEVVFPDEMTVNPGLTDVSSYSFVSVLGACPTTPAAVYVGSMGVTGATSVIIDHSGTTMGGIYTMVVTGLIDIAGIPIEIGGRNITNFLAIGQSPSYLVAPISGDEIALTFREELVNTVDVLDVLNYEISTLYPVPVTVNSVTFPYGTPDTVMLNVTGMTSVDYDILVGPSKTIYYDGSYLPNSSTEFNGTEVGTGSSSIIGSALRLNKPIGGGYGWGFEDITGKLVPASSFRADVTINTSATVYVPPIFDAILGAFSVSDGVTQVDLILGRTAGVETLSVSSGGFFRSVNCSWSSSTTKLSLIRNQYAGTYTVLVNDSPVVTDLIASFNGAPTIPTGSSFLLGGSYSVSNLRMTSMNINSTSTVYSISWNFIHSKVSSFVGSALLARKKILTENGPLVKSWGDNTPATKNDVAVRVNGTDVDVVGVNPYLGEIELDIPIPLMPAGTISVETDYCWIPSPILEIGDLNTDGSNLNVWANPSGLVDPVVSGGMGAVDTETRFNMRLVLGPVERPQPLARSPRFFGFEEEYSSVLNDGTSLILNQDPNSISIQKFEHNTTSETFKYEGTLAPSSSGWILNGVDSGGVDVGLGTYSLIDSSSGRYPLLTKAFYYRDVDLSDDSVVYFSTRFKVESYTLDGVFTGIGFGLHNNRRWYLIGLLEINEVKHVGYLNNGGSVELSSSWNVGPSVQITITGSNSCYLDSSDVPVSLESGDRFQVLSGLQSGIYTVSSIVSNRNGTTSLTVSPSFPSSHEIWGASEAQASFEILWDENPFSYRMIVNTLSGVSTTYVSGEISSSVGSISSLGAPYPVQSPFSFSQDGKGQVFWGSLGGTQENDSTWSFVRYGTAPISSTVYSNGVIVSSDMTVLPQEEDSSEWFISSGAGFSSVTGSGLLLKSTYSSLDERFFEYKRIEPFLNNQLSCDVDVRFRVESECSGFGDASVVIRDTRREIRFGTVLYTEGGTPWRQMVSMPSVSMCGKSSNSGWNHPTNLSLSRTDNAWIVTKTSSPNGGFFYNDLDLSSITFVDKGIRVLEARLSVESYTSVTGETGIAVLAEAGDVSNRIAGLTLLTSPNRVALTSSGTPIQSYLFDWDDGGIHTYRVLIDEVADAVTLVIDDSVQVPTVLFSLFDASASNTGVFFGSFNGGFSSVVKYDSVSCKVKMTSNYFTTYGIYIGGDKDDIDSYIIPRSDGLNVPNSDSTAVVVNYDWSIFNDLRIHFDPLWGVTVLDPTIPPPPYTPVYDPFISMVSVEYQRLPILEESFGSISWGSVGDGSVDPEFGSVSQSRWEYVRYHVFMYNNGETLPSPNKMVLNYFNVANSGELTKDTTPETRTIISSSSTLVKISDCGISADNVLIVSVDGLTIPRSLWSFNKEDQEVTFSVPLSSSNKAVTLVFEPGMPVTYTYLLEQPVWEGVAVLNEGTPSEQMDQSGGGYYINVPGSLITGSNGDFIDNRTYLYLEDQNLQRTIYTDIDIIEVTDDGETGLISFACDNTFAGHGLLNIGLDGGSYNDSFSFFFDGFLGSGGSLISSPFTSPPYPILFMSGGNFVDGTIGPGTSIIYPNYGGSKYNPWGSNQTVVFDFDSFNYSDSFVVLEDTADNVPPSYTAGDLSVVPDGTPGLNSGGACLAILETPGVYSKIGPFGGLDYLDDRSFLAGVNADQPIGIPQSDYAFTLYGGSALPTSFLEIFDPLEIDLYRLPPLSSNSNTGTLSVTTGVGGKTYSIPAWATGIMIQVDGADVYYRAGAAGLVPADLDIVSDATDAVLLDGMVASFRRIAGQDVIALITAIGTATVIITPFVD